MATLRLRKLLQPAQAERLLEALATRSGALPEGAYQVRDPDSLPLPLRNVLMQVTGTRQVWTCWAAGLRMWLFTGEISVERSRERGTPVLRVDRYGEDGGLQDAAAWMTDPDGKSWRRCGD